MPKKPAPFKRPSIEINNGPKRSWQWVSPEILTSGDTVADLGVVSTVKIHRLSGDESPIEAIEVWAKLGKLKTYQATDVVHAFIVPKE